MNDSDDIVNSSNDSTTNHQLIKKLEVTVFATYVYSLFCTLSSCSIFSKLALGIQRKCTDIAKYLKNVDIPEVQAVAAEPNYENPYQKIYDYLKTIYPAKVNDEKIKNFNMMRLKLLYLQR